MSNVSVNVQAPGGTILMRRPQLGNALSSEMIDDLELAFDDLHQEKKIRYIILAGAGDHFCTGMDLRELHQTRQKGDLQSMAAIHHQWSRVSELVQKILRFPKPVIAAVDGNALGAGLGLALACDLIVASESSSFGSPATRVGLIGGVVGPLLSFRLGGSVAARMLLTGESISSEEAVRINLVSSRVRSDQVWVEATRIGGQCISAPNESIQLTKRLLNETIGEHLGSQLTIGAGMGATSCSTESAAEGLAAFQQKRPPTWP